MRDTWTAARTGWTRTTEMKYNHELAYTFNHILTTQTLCFHCVFIKVTAKVFLIKFK